VQQTGQRNAEVDDAYDILHSADPEITPRMRAGAVTRIEDVLDDQIADWAADNAPPLSQSQAMGINPSAGPTSAAAAIAVDSGATEVVQRHQAEQQAAELAKKQDKSQNSGRDSSAGSEVVSATGCSCLRSNAGVWC